MKDEQKILFNYFKEQNIEKENILFELDNEICKKLKLCLDPLGPRIDFILQYLFLKEIKREIEKEL